MLATAMTCNMTGVSAAAQPAVMGSFFQKIFGGDDSDKDEGAQTDTQKKIRSQAYGSGGSSKADSVTLDIGQGDILISGKEISGYDTEGNQVTKTSPRYVVTGSTQDHSIKVADGANANIVLSNVNISRTGEGQSPFEIADDSDGDVSVTLEGTNNLQAGDGAAAIQKSGTNGKSPSKSGQLKITCGNTSPGHVCDSSCGTLVAAGGEGAAAIGGAAGKGTSKIDITGGTITAAGGIGGGSGGEGTKMEFSGGVIDAGTINGKTDGKDNVLNGDVLLFADSTADMKLKKGTVYQRGTGTGTVYGDTEWSQAMVDHLVATGGTMDIPAESKAAVTVDGATDISNLAFTENSQVKVDTSKIPAATPAEQAIAEGTAPMPEETAPTPEEVAPTPEITEEATAAPEPTEEATATPEPTEEVTATPEPTEEATKAPAKVRARKAVPTEGPAVEEAEQGEVRASVSGGSTSDNTDPILHTTATTANVRDASGNPVVAGDDIFYGQRLIVRARVTFYRRTQTNGVNANDPNINKVQCYLSEPNAAASDKVMIGETEIPENAGISQNEFEIDIPVIVANSAIQPNNGKEYVFTAEFGGSAEYPASSSTPVRYVVHKGTLTPADDTVTLTVPAGKKLGEVVDLSRDITVRPENLAGVSVNGHWEWDTGVSVNDTLYPVTQDRNNRYRAIFEFTSTGEQDKYTTTCRLTVVLNVVTEPLPDNVTVNVSLSENRQRVSGHDGKLWYNVDSGDITIDIDRYKILPITKAPTSYNGWEQAVAKGQSNQVLKCDLDDPDTMFYHDGNYSVYVQEMGGDQRIQEAVISDLNIDRRYPLIKTPINQRITGKTGTFQFECPDEAREGSGIYQYTLYTQRRPNGSQSLNAAPSRDEIAASFQKSQQGDFAVTTFDPNTHYDLYLLVEDNAKNETQYIRRVVDESGNPTGTAWSKDLTGGRNSYFAYDFETLNPDITGEATLTVTDKDGTLKPRGNVAAQDILQVDVKPDDPEITVNDLHYEWLGRSDDGNESRLPKSLDRPTYTVQDDDIGKVIVCHVTSTKTSGYLQVATKAKVGLGPCPEEYAPVDGVEDLVNRTFTFTGVVGITYEYCINGGAWTDVTASAYEKFMIEVGDTTVLSGNLLVRAKETDRYMASDPPLANDESYISTGELGITMEGDEYYGGTLQAVVNSQSIDSGLFSYQWSCDGTVISGEEGSSYVVRKEDIGKKIGVKVSITGYPGADNQATSGTIKKRPVDVTVKVTPKVYDGTTTAEAEVTVNGVINGDNVTASASVEFENKNAGEDKSLRITNKRENGDLTCYAVKWPNNSDVKGTILPAVLDLTMQASDKVYDGTTDAVVTFEAEPLAGDTVEVSGTGQFADKNVGTNKKVTPKDVVITGPDADNYTGTGSTASTTASITAKSIQIEKITVEDKVYDGTTEAVITATFKGAVDDVSYTYTAAFESPNVGKDKPVSAEITLEGDSAKNYTLANGKATGTGNITRAPAPYDESDIPQGLTGIEGKKLSSVFIGKGFNWAEPSTVMKTVGRHSYPAIYNPDPSQYGDREMQLEVLVQCADHTWGDWSITVEPTKEEVGERQRICGVCGYVETETIPRAPYIATEDTKVGWDDIIQAINNAASGTEIPVAMNGTETLPASVLDALQGREVSIVLQMGDGITWTIRGEDITASTLKDINMALTLYTDNIPSDVLESYSKDKTVIQLHLAYSGDFGFVATLRIPLGDEYAGIDSTLYYYNPTRERMEHMDSNKVTADGIGRYDFTHASDYAVVIDKKPDADVQGGDTPSGNNNTSGTVTPIAPTGTAGGSATGGATTGGASAGRVAATGTASSNTSSNTVGISSNGAKTEDNTPIALYVVLLLAGAGGVGAAWIYRKRRNTKE